MVPNAVVFTLVFKYKSYKEGVVFSPFQIPQNLPEHLVGGQCVSSFVT